MLKKALDVVQLVALRGELPVREIAAAMKLPKSTAHRLVANLVDARLLQPYRRPDGDVYAVGELIGELSGAAFLWRPLVQHARGELTAARDDTGETVGLHILYGERRVLLDQVVSQHQHRWVYGNAMVPMPLLAGASAKMLLAMLPEEEMLKAVQRNFREGGGSDKGKGPDAFLQGLREIRRQGYSISSDEINPGITSIAVPVVERSEQRLPFTVISLAAPSVRLRDKALRQCRQRLLVAAGSIAKKLRASVRP